MINKHYDNREFHIKEAEEIVNFNVEYIFVKIKKHDGLYYVTTKSNKNNPEMLRFSSPSYPRAVVEYKMVLKIALDELEEIAWESEDNQ